MKRILKTVLLVTLLAATVLALFSCGNTSAAKDASGSWQGVEWTYYKETQTLILKAKGEMPNAASASEIGWASVRTSVKRVKFETLDGQYPTTIGSYAFYGMSSLETVELPQTVTSIGVCSFAFCKSLAEIALPTTLQTINESAFEACSSLASIKVPAGVTTIGPRAFAFCRSLEIALIGGKIDVINSWTFKDCTALSSLALTNKENVEFSPTAFEGAGIGADKAVPYSESIIITVYYKDASGNEISPALKDYKTFGENYSYLPDVIDGYTATGTLQYNGVAASSDLEFTFTYEKNAETEAVVETEPVTSEPESEEEKNPTSIIIALVIFGVVIGGICVGAVLLMRSDKKQQKNGTTVRKNSNGKSKKDSKKK